MWIRCKAVKEEGGFVYVECSYFRLPWEPSEVPYEGELLGAPANGRTVRLGIRGKVVLRGREGERGRLGPKEFYFQIPEIGVLGEMNGVVVVYILGKGRYAGTIYGARVEGEGEEAFGVAPLKGNKARLEVGGIWVEKELPDPKSLKRAQLDLPYRVVGAGEKLKVELYDEFDVIGERHYKVKGTVELPYGSVIGYRGVPERPSRVEAEKVFELWAGSVRKALKGREGLVVHTSRTTLVVGRGVKDVGLATDCYYDDDLYAVGRRAYVEGRVFELPSAPYACTRAGRLALFSIPSKPVFLTIRLFSPTIAISVPPTEFPWEIPWSSERNAALIAFDVETGEERRVELLPGVYGLYRRKHLLVHNLFGELRVYDERLSLLWRREANGVRDVAEEDFLALWTYRPPRIRVYQDFFKQVFKTATNNYHVGLCSERGLLYAVDGEQLRIFLPKLGFYELKAKIEGGLACEAVGGAIVVSDKKKVAVWRPKLQISFD
ncbi:MAG: hypothetical protein GXO07_06735 [Crenarchaeota archaeon]|nr:hypothetical protein [Thermoproteota archaeon]